jgi:catechol 2,3-dioxygenase-like lactoylglutathione lyase family enzyme
MMAIQLDHTIVPSRDRLAAARFFADLFGLAVAPPAGPFAPVPVNAALTFDFSDDDGFEAHHYGFLVDEATFDAALDRAQAAGLAFGAGPEAGWDRQINRLHGGRGVYFLAPDGHTYEIFTRRPA